MTSSSKKESFGQTKVPLHCKSSDYENMRNKHNSSKHATDSDTASRLVSVLRKISTLPPELKEAILVEYLRANLVPGKLFLLHKPADTEYFIPKLDVVSDLDLRLFNVARTMVYSENTFVIAEGGAESTTKFLEELSPESLQLIQSVELRFSWKDVNSYWSPGDRYMYIKQKLDGLDPDEVHRNKDTISSEYTAECAIFSGRLQTVWIEKFHNISTLPIRRLRLDLTRAFNIDDVFLCSGIDFFARVLATSHRGFEKLEIVAPELALENELKDMYEDARVQEVSWEDCEICRNGVVT
ncbi:hypothetical protein MMC24_004668 [Lignoscripta atroalba]|nr:hypothetical protein [Lignoscripta atroalba]